MPPCFSFLTAQIGSYNCHGQHVPRNLEREIEQLIRFVPEPENDDRILLFLLRDVLSALTTRGCSRNMAVQTFQISEVCVCRLNQTLFQISYQDVFLT